jgi:hypothetical protein
VAPHVVTALARSLAGRAALRAAPPIAAGMTAYDIGSSVLGGLRQGEDVAGADRALRQGNPSFFGQQEAIRQGAYGEEPEAGPYYDDPPAELLASSEAAPEPPIDWDAAIAAKGPMLDRISDEQMRQLANALGSGEVAARGPAMPALQDEPMARKLARGMMMNAGYGAGL